MVGPSALSGIMPKVNGSGPLEMRAAEKLLQIDYQRLGGGARLPCEGVEKDLRLIVARSPPFHRSPDRVDDPVFGHAASLILASLGEAIDSCSRRRQNFDGEAEGSDV